MVTLYGPCSILANLTSLLPFAVFIEDLSVCALPYVQYAKGSPQASSWLSSGPQQLTSHPTTQCYSKRWSVSPLAWCLHLAQLGPDEDPRKPFQHWKRGLASQTGGLYGPLHTTVVHDLIGYPSPLHPPTKNFSTTPNTHLEQMLKSGTAIHCTVCFYSVHYAGELLCLISEIVLHSNQWSYLHMEWTAAPQTLPKSHLFLQGLFGRCSLGHYWR